MHFKDKTAILFSREVPKKRSSQTPSLRGLKGRPGYAEARLRPGESNPYGIFLDCRVATLLAMTFCFVSPAHAQSCDVTTRGCLVEELLTEAEQIDNDTWQAQIYREAAKSMAKHGNIDGAIALIPKIKNPDTLALTIRGIGMEAAGLNLSQENYDAVFNVLKEESYKIEHLPSQAIAFTYIAMSQAFAGDDDGAWQTAASMENDALRNKAYGETAEIQAEMGKYNEAMKSISYINQASFRNKAYTTVSKILADEGYYQNAFYAAQNIDNPYKKANAYQYILDAQDEAVIESDQGIAND